MWRRGGGGGGGDAVERERAGGFNFYIFPFDVVLHRGFSGGLQMSVYLGRTES